MLLGSVQAKMQEMQRTTDNNVAQRLAQLEAAAAETAAVHEAMQAAHCRQVSPPPFPPPAKIPKLVGLSCVHHHS